MGRDNKKLRGPGSIKKWKTRQSRILRCKRNKNIQYLNKYVSKSGYGYGYGYGSGDDDYYDYWDEKHFPTKKHFQDYNKPYDGTKIFTPRYENIVNNYIDKYIGPFDKYCAFQNSRTNYVVIWPVNCF
jgi:hypothetical protein